MEKSTTSALHSPSICPVSESHRAPLLHFGASLAARSIVLFLLLSSFLLVDATADRAVVIGGQQYQQVDGRWQVISATGRVFDVDPEVITVRFAPGVSEEARADLIRANGTQVLRANRLGFLDLRVPAGADVIDVVLSFLGSELIDSAEPNSFGVYLVIPNDPRFGQQWHLQQGNDADVDAPEAWDLETGARQVVVGILDSGTDWTHDDMGIGRLGGGYYQNIFLNPGEDAWTDADNPNTGNGIDDDNNGYVDDWKGWDFANGNNDSRGTYDHGTRVAGIVGAKTDNGFGVAGVAGGFGGPGSGLMIAGVGDDYPVGSILDDAIIYAADNGAKVITMSLTVGQSTAIDNALEYAWNAGLLIDCASGNGFGSPVEYPARNPNVIAVGATNQSDLLAYFSSMGVDQEVAAPGVSILSCTFNDGFGSGDGTSFAAPIVAGIAALMFSINPGLTNADARQILRDTAEKVGPYDYNWNPAMPGHSLELGYGRVNASAAVFAVLPTGLSAGSGVPTARPIVLMPNAPNPFNPMTQIRYSLAENGRVTISVHTTLGRHLRTLVDEIQPAGVHTVRWDGRDGLGRPAASGVYLYTVTSGEVTLSGKMLLAD